MKHTKSLSLLILLFTFFVSCNSQTTKNGSSTAAAITDKVEVYYFHFSRRCATCNAVESVSKDAIAEFYGNKVSFASINLDEPEGEEKGKQLEVSGQTLLIVSGNTKINITSEAFLNARSNPDKLKEIIRQKIDSLL